MNNLEKKEVAQEVEVQEQHTGKCQHCNKLNETTVPKRLNVNSKFCMYCGKEIQYIKTDICLNK